MRHSVDLHASSQHGLDGRPETWARVLEVHEVDVAMADPVAELTPQVEDELAVAPALLVEALLVHLPLVSGLESPLQLATEHVEEIEGILQSKKHK